MSIYKLPEGYVISSDEVWLPGSYEDERAARFAFRLPHEVLQQLQDTSNIRAGGSGGVITWGDIAKAAAQHRQGK